MKGDNMETVNLEDVRTILQTHEGETLYPLMITNIIKEIRKKSLEKIEKIDYDKNPFL